MTIDHFKSLLPHVHTPVYTHTHPPWQLQCQVLTTDHQGIPLGAPSSLAWVRFCCWADFSKAQPWLCHFLVQNPQSLSSPAILCSTSGQPAVRTLFCLVPACLSTGLGTASLSESWVSGTHIPGVLLPSWPYTVLLILNSLSLSPFVCLS